MSATLSSRSLSMIAAALLLTASSTVLAQSAPQSGWRMPNLIPSLGSGGNNGGRSTMSKVIDPFGLLPGTSKAQNSNASYGQPKQPSMLQKMNTSTKKMASQTADFLNPFDDGPAKVQEERFTGSNSSFNQQANQRKVQSSKTTNSWTPGWLGGSPTAEKKPKTVNDFLSQPRLQP
jgi:hypothetical protein